MDGMEDTKNNAGTTSADADRQRIEFLASFGKQTNPRPETTGWGGLKLWSTNPGSCPDCGRCGTCGRGGYGYHSVYPYYTSEGSSR